MGKYYAELKEMVIDPIVIVNKMFLKQLKKIITEQEEVPQNIRNLYADMNQMVKQYEERE